jgi:LytS/YehU family sensor histidine kinase
MKLSELLSYVLYESEKERVPLEKELEIVKTFLILKKTFYPKALKFSIISKLKPMSYSFLLFAFVPDGKLSRYAGAK